MIFEFGSNGKEMSNLAKNNKQKLRQEMAVYETVFPTGYISCF